MYRYLLALALTACTSPTMPPPDASPDTLSCEPVRCDRDCLAAGSGAGVCRAMGCVCVGAPDASLDATIDTTVVVDGPRDTGIDADVPRDTSIADVGRDIGPLPWTRDFAVDHIDPAVELLFRNTTHPTEIYDYRYSRQPATGGSITYCSLIRGRMQFVVGAAYEASARDGVLVTATLDPPGRTTGILQFGSRGIVSVPMDAQAVIVRERMYYAEGSMRINVEIRIRYRIGLMTDIIGGIPGITADPTYGEFRLFGCPVM